MFKLFVCCASCLILMRAFAQKSLQLTPDKKEAKTPQGNVIRFQTRGTHFFCNGNKEINMKLWNTLLIPRVQVPGFHI